MTHVSLSKAERAQWDRADKLIDDGDYLEAGKLLDKLLNKKRSDPAFYAYRGLVRYRLERYSDAIEDFSAALALKPDAANTLFLRARSREECELYRDAVEDYNRVLALSPETADAYAHKGFCLEQVGKLYEARSAYESALQIDPQESLALAGLKVLDR